MHWCQEFNNIVDGCCWFNFYIKDKSQPMYWLIDCVMFNIPVRYLLSMKTSNNDSCSTVLLPGIIPLPITLYYSYNTLYDRDSVETAAWIGVI